MRVIQRVLGSRLDAAFAERLHHLEHHGAVDVLRVPSADTARRRLRLRAKNLPDALELGYHAGNLHWRVRFADGALLVALEAPAEDYLVRLGDLAGDGRLAHDVVDDAPGEA